MRTLSEKFPVSPDVQSSNLKFIARNNGPMLLLSLCVAAFFWIGLELEHGHLIDRNGFVLGKDFLNFWHYGLSAWSGEGAIHYNPYTYNAKLDAIVGGQDYPDQLFSYPPHLMLLAAPFGLLDYYPALALFTFLGLALYWACVVRNFDGRAQRLALAAMPTVAVFLTCGQFSAYLAVLLITLYRSLDTRPLLAGFLIALLTIKPQHGILIPLFLMFTGRWRVFIYATLLSGGLIGASLLIHGREAWEAFLHSSLAHQSTTLMSSGVVVFGLMPTAFVNSILAGGAIWFASLAQFVFSIIAVLFLMLTLGRTRDEFLRFAALIVATLIATPYLMAYDTLVLGWIMLTLSMRAPMGGLEQLAYRLVMAICPIGVVLSLYSVPGTALVLPLLAIWIFKVASIRTLEETRRARRRWAGAAQV